MNRSLFLEGARIQLLKQLVYFDDEKNSFLNQYFPEYNQKRSRVERALSDYSATLENIFADFNEGTLNSAVLIGSEVVLRYADDDTSESFTIVFPHQADPNRNRVSFLSPVGFQLLMARMNETHRLHVPSGEISVTIEDITFVNGGDVG